MRYRKLTALGDYSFGNGQQDFYKDVPEAVGQACKTRLLLWLGEWFLDITDGTPYFQGVLGKFSIDQANVVIKQRAIGTQGLTQITNYLSSLNPDNRDMQVAFSIDTIYGPSTVQLLNYVQY